MTNNNGTVNISTVKGAGHQGPVRFGHRKECSGRRHHIRRQRPGRVDRCGSAKVNNSFGSVTVRNIHGKLMVNNSNGAIDVNTVSGSADLNTSFGSITFANMAGT